MDKEALIRKILALEWKMFSRVHNEGGRADCQDDWETFAIMRGAQFEAWSSRALECYFAWVQKAETLGRNLLTEKYAHMMRSTAPEQYLCICDEIPQPDSEARETAERICAELLAQTEEYARKYPRLALQGRVLYSFQDTAYNTSVETYQRSELYTYSADTLHELEACILEKKAEGINFAECILRNTVKKYGFSSLEQAEAAAGK